jgi:hypothetical protein
MIKKQRGYSAAGSGISQIGQIAFLVHQVSFLSQYLGVTGAATAVSITAGASIAGRLFLGTFVDRCDKLIKRELTSYASNLQRPKVLYALLRRFSSNRHLYRR